MKKLFSLVLVLALVLSCVPAVWGDSDSISVDGDPWPTISSWSGNCTITIDSGVTSISGYLIVPSAVTKLTIVCNNNNPCAAGGTIFLTDAPADFELVFTGGGTLTAGDYLIYDDSLSITGTPNVTLGGIDQLGSQVVTLTLQDVNCGAVSLREDGSILEVRGACRLLGLSAPTGPIGISFTLRGDGTLTIGDLSTTLNAISFLSCNLNLAFSGDLTLYGVGGAYAFISGTLNFLSLPNSLIMEVGIAPTVGMIRDTISYASGLTPIQGFENFGVDGVPTFYWQKPTPPTPPTPPAPETDPRPRDFGSTGGDYWPSLETLIQTQPPAEKQNPGMGGK